MLCSQQETILEFVADLDILVISGFDVFFPEKWSIGEFFAAVSSSSSHAEILGAG